MAHISRLWDLRITQAFDAPSANLERKRLHPLRRAVGGHTHSRFSVILSVIIGVNILNWYGAVIAQSGRQFYENVLYLSTVKFEKVGLIFRKNFALFSKFCLLHRNICVDLCEMLITELTFSWMRCICMMRGITFLFHTMITLSSLCWEQMNNYFKLCERSPLRSFFFSP